MKLTKEELDEFKLIYKKEYGIELDDKLAESYAMKLLKYLSIVKNMPRPKTKLHLKLDKGYNSNEPKLHNKTSANGMPKGQSCLSINSPSDDVVLAQ